MIVRRRLVILADDLTKCLAFTKIIQLTDLVWRRRGARLCFLSVLSEPCDHYMGGDEYVH